MILKISEYSEENIGILPLLPLILSWEIYEFFRSNHRRRFIKKLFLKIFVIFTGKWQAWNFIKRDSSSSVFLWIFRNFQDHLFRRTSANGCFWFFKTATERQWAAASVLTLLLSLDNLLTGYEQWSYWQFNRNLSICVSLAKDWLMAH